MFFVIAREQRDRGNLWCKLILGDCHNQSADWFRNDK